MNIGFYREIITGICLGSKSLLSSLLSYMSGTDLTERAIEGRITTVPPLEAVPQHLDEQHLSPPDSDQCFIQNHGLVHRGVHWVSMCFFVCLQPSSCSCDHIRNIFNVFRIFCNSKRVLVTTQ